MEFELVADQRDLTERAVEYPFAFGRVALQDEPQNRDEDEQQREQRDEGVVGDQRRELARLVVRELLDYGDHEAQPPTSLLEAVEGVQPVPEAHWRGGSPAALGRHQYVSTRNEEQ